MQSILKIGLSLCAAGILSYGASWNAKLMDANCAAASSSPTQKKEKTTQSCAPTETTTSFAIEANGKVYNLDASGNQMATTAMKAGTLKPDKEGDVHVTVRGTMQGDTIKVDSLTPRAGGKEEKKG